MKLRFFVNPTFTRIGRRMKLCVVRTSPSNDTHKIYQKVHSLNAEGNNIYIVSS